MPGNPFERIKYTDQDQQNSYRWFQDQVRTLRNMSPSRLMRESSTLLRKNISPGGLYLFFYNPKTKENLPYYDAAPLVFPFASTSDGFMGYNLHYLPPILRFQVMGSLMNIHMSTDSEERKIANSFGTLNARSVQKYYSPCIKRYIKSHVMSKFLEIPQDSWLTASLLPIDRFVKASNAKVWKDSLSKV